jgi:hypothetical protein
VKRYGFEYRTGVVTAVVAIALLITALVAAWRGGSSAIRRTAVSLALIEFILVGFHIARVHVFPEYFVYGPNIGLIAVLAGAAISMAGAALLRPRSDQSVT